MLDSYLLGLPWIFPGAPLKVNGAPGNIQGNWTALSRNLRFSFSLISQHMKDKYLIIYPT